MGKSSKKTNVQVAPAVPAAAKSVKKGKRDAEVTLEKEVSAKKQKKEIENAVPKEDVKNLKKALKNAPLKKKSETSSSEDDSSSDSEEEVKVPPKKQNKLAKSLKKKSSSSEESSSDDETVKTVPASDKKAAVATKNGSFAAVTKKGKESSSSESDSDEDEEVAPKAAKVVPAAKKQTTVTNLKKKDESSDSSENDSDTDEDDDDSDESDVEPQPKKSKITDSVPSSKTKPVAKTVKNESNSSEEDEDDSSEESSDDEPSKQQQAKKVTQASKKSNSSDSSEESSDEESEDEEPLKTPKKDNDVEMKDASVISAEKQTAKKSEKKTNQASGSRTLFIGNLSYDVGQDDVAEFFKAAGEVVDVRLATALDGSFKGFGHVEFATEEDAKKALELNGNELFGRGVRLDVARERGSYTPQSGKDSYQKGGKGQSQTIFVKGFDRSLDEDQIRSSLEEHFGSCGEITRISVPKDYETGAPKGIAYMDFTDQESFNKAFELNGSDLGGYTLTVDEAKPRADNRDGGWSGGRDGGGRSGGRFGGRDGGRRGGRGDRGRGRDFGGRGRGRGGTPFRHQSSGTASAGKKTTFGDD